MIIDELIVLMPYTNTRLNGFVYFLDSKMAKLYLLVSMLFLFFILTGCSAAGGAFGTAAPSDNFAALPDTVTPQQARFLSGKSNPDPRILADMQALARQQSSGVYLIGPSDLLTITVFQAKELSGEVRVNERGAITLPLLGSVRIAGLSQMQAEQRLAQLLGANLLQNPQVGVFIKEATSQRVTVEGEVQKQGVFPLNGSITVLQAIALAGGFSEKAKTDEVALFRKEGSNGRVYYLDIDLVRSGRIGDPVVMSDDRIVVSRSEEQEVTVEGEVNNPNVHNFTKPTTLLQVIALSKGLTSLAAPNKVILFRRDQEGGENAYGVDLSAIRQGKARDPFVQNGDRIVAHRSNSRYWLNQATTLLSPLNLITGLATR